MSGFPQMTPPVGEGSGPAGRDEHTATGPAVGGSRTGPSADPRWQSEALRAEIRALELKQCFLERVVAWHEARPPAPAPVDRACEGAGLRALGSGTRLSSDTLSLAVTGDRTALLHL